MSANEEDQKVSAEEEAADATLDQPAAQAQNDPTVTETTEEAVAAAVAAAATMESTAQASATARTPADPNAPTDRDVVLGEGSAGHKANFLLQDIIHLHRILWKLHDKPLPTTRDQVKEMALHIIDLIQNGKSFELAGMKDVPKPFLKSTGRFFGQDQSTKAWTILPPEEVQKTMCDIILEDFKSGELGSLSEMPYRNLKDWISKKQEKSATPLMPEGRDAILLPCRDLSGEKMYEQQAGNKTLFSLASQLVTASTNTPEKRVEAALFIMKGLDDSETMAIGDKDVTTTSKSRYLIRSQREDQSVSWDLMDAASAAEFTLIFAFEVYLEKEIHIQPLVVAAPQQQLLTTAAATFAPEDFETQEPGTVPVAEPTDNDVLFGRGGMTNSHPGAYIHCTYFCVTNCVCCI